MPRLAVVLDTNSYVGMSPTTFEAVVERESQHSVQAYANYFVATELLANLALRNGKKYERSLAALKRLWAHCKVYDGSKENLVLIADAEDQTAKTLFGRGIPQRREEAQLYGSTIGEIVNVSPSSAWCHETWAVIDHLRDHVDQTEAGWTDSLWRNVVLTLQPTATTWFDVSRPSIARQALLSRIDAGDAFPLVASGFVIKAAEMLGEALDAKRTADLVPEILRHFPTPVWLYSNLVREMIVNGPDMTKAKRANSIWDLQVAFSTGSGARIGPAPIWLISNDQAILDAATSANASWNVRSFSDYVDLIGRCCDDFADLVTP